MTTAITNIALNIPHFGKTEDNDPKICLHLSI